MLRIPIRQIYAYTSRTSLTTVDTFDLPFQDFDSLLVKSYMPILTGASAGISFFVQSSDDGFTTAYDLGCITFATTATTAQAKFLTIPVNGGDGKYIGAPSATALADNSTSGLPLLSHSLRVVIAYSGVVTTLAPYLNIYAINQSPHA